MPLRPPRPLPMRLAEALLHAVAPRLCEVCGDVLTDAEDVMCLRCELAMPMVNIHGSEFSELHRRLLSPIPVERAGAMFWYYRDDSYALLIHHAKYDGRPRIGRVLARAHARRMMADGFFDGVDMIVPVPLHRRKLLRRGYNQSLHIARGLGEATGVPVRELLEMTRRHGSQTRRNAYSRWINVKGSYGVRSEMAPLLHGSHVMLVDDVLTTGATLLDCIRAIHRAAPSAQISVFTLAATHLR